MKKIRMWFHLPSLVGFALAFAGIPYYDNFLFICHVPCPPVGPNYIYNNAIALVPISVAIVLSAFAMFAVYVKVLRQSRTANRWRFGKGGGANGKLVRKVFWQAFFFVVALYGSWPILILAEYSGNNQNFFQLYWFWVLTLTLAPLQGFFNLFVYTRPKMMRCWKQWRRQRQQQGHETPIRHHGSWVRVGVRISFPGKGRLGQNAAATWNRIRRDTKSTSTDESNFASGSLPHQGKLEEVAVDPQVSPNVTPEACSADSHPTLNDKS